MEQPGAAHGMVEVRRQRVAISAVPQAIVKTRQDLQHVFDTIIDSAMRLCRAKRGTFRLFEDMRFRLVAHETIHAVSESKRAASANGDPSARLANGDFADRAAYLTTTTSCSSFLSVAGELTPG
jgi:hypothetical protein